jgi:hypothetical protein
MRASGARGIPIYCVKPADTGADRDLGKTIAISPILMMRTCPCARRIAGVNTGLSMKEEYDEENRKYWRNRRRVCHRYLYHYSCICLPTNLGVEHRQRQHVHADAALR